MVNKLKLQDYPITDVEMMTMISPNEFGTKMDDGRLTEISDNNIFRLREAIRLSRSHGRTLTED